MGGAIDKLVKSKGTNTEGMSKQDKADFDSKAADANFELQDAQGKVSELSQMIIGICCCPVGSTMARSISCRSISRCQARLSRSQSSPTVSISTYPSGPTLPSA